MVVLSNHLNVSEDVNMFFLVHLLFYLILLLCFFLVAETKSKNSQSIIGPVDPDYAEFLNLQAQKGSSTTPTSFDYIIGPVDPDYAEYLKLQGPKGSSNIPTSSHYVIGNADSDYAMYLEC